MVGDNKILTVSYGTFSCTLEGFDDPFNTMKAIAEYFRDLAAGDRFFGAEPPQPDAEMLHRIAEQTIQSRVNAEVADNGLILRQAEASAPAAEPAPAPVEEVATDVTPTERFGGNTVAEKLQRIRAVVANEAAGPVSGFAEDEHATEVTPSAFVAPEIKAVDENEEEIDLSGVISETDDADAEADAAAKAEEKARAQAEAVAKAEEEASAQAEAEAKAQEETRAQAEADAKAQEEARAQAEAEAEAAAKAEEDARAEVEEDAPMAAEAEVDEDAQSEDVGASDEASNDTAEAGDDEFEDIRPMPRRRIVVQKISRAALADPQDADAPLSANEADLSPEAEAALMRELADLETDAAEAVTSEAEEAETDIAGIMADFDDEPLAKDAVEDSFNTYEDETPEVEAEAEDATDTDVEDDAEEVHVAEDAEADADSVDVEADEAEVAEDNDDEHDAARAARIARRSIETEDEEAALERLMDMTSSRLDNDESSVRRASIAHLKAAVAATKADSSLAEDAAAEEERELDQYRDDLARVVKPGRARPRGEGSSRPRPAPLVLVSEQRVDAPEADPAAVAASVDVRPRRISHGNLALQEELDEDLDAETRAGNIFEDEDVESFGEYAARHSALELPDMLEAAAAHYTWVEKQPRFTRPMLMRKIASISEAHAVSREDGLRAFGTLLRQGVIVKDGNGKFAIAESSRFAPEAQSDDA